MTCREFVEFLDAYLSGELSSAERGEFERHLEVCESCVSYLGSYQQVVDLGSSLLADPDGAVPEDVPADLIAAILAARDRQA